MPQLAMGFHEEEVLGKAYDRRLMRRLLAYLAGYRWLGLLAIALLAFTSFLELVQPYLLKLAIDRYILARAYAGLLTLSLIFLGVLFLKATVRYVQAYLTQYLGQQVIFRLRREIFAHLQRLPIPFFDRNPVGRLMTRLTSDVEAINELVTAGVVSVFGDLYTLVGIVIAMLLIDWRLALISFAVLPPLAFATRLFSLKARTSYRLVRDKLARINACLQENITGMGTVQLFVRQQENFEQFDQINRQYRDANLQSIFYQSVFYPLVEVMEAASLALIIYYGGGRFLAGAVTLGTLVAFIDYARKFFAPVRDLSEKYNIFQSSMASSERIFRLLDTEGEVNGNGLRHLGQVRGKIEFRHVWFAYRPGEWVLRDVSFTIGAGERVALVGATGAGKSTVISLLNRFYEIDKGEILLDGIDIRRLERGELRRQFGVVLQEPFLFSGDVLGNIRLGDRQITEKQVMQAAEVVNAAPFIRDLPRTLAQPIGERGCNLSTGQKQLLAFARSLLHNPPILILDEATSCIDSETERLIQEALQRLMQGRTALIIAHRLSTIREVDRIIVLHRGEVREQGNHQHLLNQQGIYAHLYRLQAEGSPLGAG